MKLSMRTVPKQPLGGVPPENRSQNLGKIFKKYLRRNPFTDIFKDVAKI